MLEDGEYINVHPKIECSNLLNKSGRNLYFLPLGYYALRLFKYKYAVIGVMSLFEGHITGIRT